ncbi:MAG: HelD family protein [Ferrimicrobium sp.]
MIHSSFVEEQRFVRDAYRRLSDLRQRVRAGMDEALGLPRGGTPQSRLERDVVIETGFNRLFRLDVGDHALVFGRIDFGPDDAMHAQAVYHIGRISLMDENGDPMVVDWRAPVAEAFYRATARNPMGLVRRVHLAVENAELSNLEEEVLDALDDGGIDSLVVGPTALYAAITRPRTTQMADIVSTIQAEQDELIRRPLASGVVVEGSPGTGKTAVALHRAAYLLYTYRWRLERQGVLVVGPSRSFVRYVRSVLPSLGESGVQLRSIGGLRDIDGPKGGRSVETVARVKGDLRLARVLARAVRDRQRPLKKAIGLSFGARMLYVTPELSQRAVIQARGHRGAHNPRAAVVERVIATALADEYLRGVETLIDDAAESVAVSLFVDDDLPANLPEETHEQIAAETVFQIRRSHDFQRIVQRIWPRLTSEEFLYDLLCHPVLLELAARGVLSPSEMGQIHMEGGRSLSEIAWSEEDAILLDEIDRLLGNATPIVFGHVIVDEAQEISPMAARAIKRRLSGTSITLLGDRAQATGAFRERTWSEIVAPLGLEHLEHIELSVNYRSPREIVALASRLRNRIGLVDHEVAIRDSGFEPEFITVPESELVSRASLYVQRFLADEAGTIAVVVPESRLRRVQEGIEAIWDRGQNSNRVTVSDVPGIKGMEFDAVVVVDADRLASTELVERFLYVAVTRATRRLTLLVRESPSQWFLEIIGASALG